MASKRELQRDLDYALNRIKRIEEYLFNETVEFGFGNPPHQTVLGRVGAIEDYLGVDTVVEQTKVKAVLKEDK